MKLYGIAVIPVLIWAYLLIGRGRFWRVAAHRAGILPQPEARCVVVLIPARNEASVIGTTVASLARQTFNGLIHLIVIDDDSTDGTAEAAVAAARAAGALSRFTLLRGAALPVGWTGKLWALSQGVAAAARLNPDRFDFVKRRHGLLFLGRALFIRLHPASADQQDGARL